MNTQPNTQSKKCPGCTKEIDIKAEVCPHCDTRFVVSVLGYCANCHTMRYGDANGNCRICGGEVIDPTVESYPLSRESVETSLESSLQRLQSRNRKGRLFKVITWLVLSLMCLFSCALAYSVMFYHEFPDIPAIDYKLFQTVDYDLSYSRPSFLKEGYYIWTITNSNDFAWPAAWIAYGENHAASLGRVEPGESKSFSNAELFNRDTKGMESVPFGVGDKVKVTLWIDFKEEKSWPVRFLKLIRMPPAPKHFSIGEWWEGLPDFHVEW
jgi:hypothetical protein